MSAIPEVYTRARSWKSMFPLPVTDLLKLLGTGYSHQPIPINKRSIANEILNPYRINEYSPYVQKMLDSGNVGEEKTIEQLQKEYSYIFKNLWSPPTTPGEFRKWRLRGDPGSLGSITFGEYINGTPDFIFGEEQDRVGEIKTPQNPLRGPEWKKDTHIYCEKPQLYFKKYWCQTFLYTLLIQEQLGKFNPFHTKQHTYHFEYTLVFNLFETELHIIEYSHDMTFDEISELDQLFNILMITREVDDLKGRLDSIFSKLPSPSLSILPFK